MAEGVNTTSTRTFASDVVPCPALTVRSSKGGISTYPYRATSSLVAARADMVGATVTSSAAQVLDRVGLDPGLRDGRSLLWLLYFFYGVEYQERRGGPASQGALAAETGETLTEAVEIALRERLDREHARHAASMRTRLARLAADVAALRVADDRTPEEIIGYDDAGLPR